MVEPGVLLFGERRENQNCIIAEIVIAVAAFGYVPHGLQGALVEFANVRTADVRQHAIQPSLAVRFPADAWVNVDGLGRYCQHVVFLVQTLI